MSSSKTSKRAQKFGELLKTPFRRNSSRSPSPSPTLIPRPASNNTPTNTPHTTILSNVLSGSSASTNTGMTSSSTVTGSTGDQSLNSRLPAFSVPLKNEAFQKAIQEYVDNLSDDDKVAFHSATDVMEKLGELQQGTTRISSSHATRMQKVQKVLQCLNQFLGSIRICIQHSPEISSLVVGGLNCILTVSTYS